MYVYLKKDVSVLFPQIAQKDRIKDRKNHFVGEIGALLWTKVLKANVYIASSVTLI